jgi:formylglycine-generating enzyme
MIAYKLLILSIFFIIKVNAQVAFTFITLPKGTYTLGQKNHYTNPLHNYTVKTNVAISNLEITNAQFDSFVIATNYITTAERLHNAKIFIPGLRAYEWLNDSSAYWRYPNGVSRGGILEKQNHPVTCISYTDILAYCKWAKVRLPNIDEWEIASRAGTVGKYFFNENYKTAMPKYANIWYANSHLIADTSDAFMYTAPVGSFMPNAWGFYDVYGNVFEYCHGTNNLNKTKTNKAVARGGSWWCSQNTCSFFNSVDIGANNKIASFSNQGFRVAKDF